jgi:uncharacterized membrane protein
MSDQNVETLSSVVAVFAILFLALVGIWDVYALLSKGRYATVTTHFQEWSRTWPLFPFVIGMLVGHLFFPSR